MAIRVLLVDDHTVVRQGFRRILETDATIEVVGEARNGEQAVALAADQRPDVIVMDLALGGLTGIEATRRIVAENGHTKVLVLTMLFDDQSVRHCLKAGARGYVLKDAEDLDLVKAVKAIAAGGSAFSPQASNVVLGAYLGAGTNQEVADDLGLLTDREREVLQLIAEGNVNREIAALLSLTVNTVETYRKHIMEKLDLRNTAEIVRFAFRRKIVT